MNEICYSIIQVYTEPFSNLKAHKNAIRYSFMS